jgi:hypothetical protein
LFDHQESSMTPSCCSTQIFAVQSSGYKQVAPLRTTNPPPKWREYLQSGMKVSKVSLSELVLDE